MSDVRAGGAYVEVGTRLTKLYAGLNAAQGRLRSFAATTRKMGMGFLKIGAMIAAPLAIGVKTFASFEDQMGHVNTMLDEGDKKYLASYRKSMRDMSVEFGEGTDTITQGMYDILSASIPAADAMGVLEASMKAAAAGATDTKTAADAVTTMLNSYGMAASEATDVTDWLFSVVKRGKTTFGELAPSIGMVATSASMAGLSMEELGAGISTMTRAGIKTRRAVMSMNALLMGFLKPTDKAAASARKFGFELNTATLKTLGLKGVIDKLVSGGASQEDLAQIFPNVRALRAIGPLMKQQAGFIKDIGIMTDRAGRAQKAFTDRTDNQMMSWKQLKQAAIELFRTIGEALKGPIGEFLTWAKKSLKTVRDWIAENPALVKWMLKLAVTLISVGAALLAISIVAKIVLGVLGVLKVAVLALKLAWGPAGLVGAILAAAIAFSLWRSKMPELLADFQKQIDATKKLHAENGTLMTKLDGLLKKQKRTNAEQVEANRIAKILTDRLGDVGIAYDKTGNAAGMAADSFAKANKKMAAQMLPMLEAQMESQRKNIIRLNDKLLDMTTGWGSGYYIRKTVLGGVPEEMIRSKMENLNAEQDKTMMQFKAYTKMATTGEGGTAKKPTTAKEAPDAAAVEAVYQPVVPRAKAGAFDFTSTTMGSFAATTQARPTQQILGYQLEELRQIREATEKLEKKTGKGGLAEA